MLLYRSDLNISEFFRQTFRFFLQFSCKIRHFWIRSIDFAQISMKFCRNFADVLETLEKFRNFGIFNFLRYFKRKFLNLERILTQLRSEQFVWFGPSPTEPFNSGLGYAQQPRPCLGLRRLVPRRRLSFF